MDDHEYGRSLITTSFASADKRIVATAAAFLLLYCLVLGTYAGEQNEALRAAGSICGLIIIVAWAEVMRRGADDVDRLVIVSLLLFLAACLASSYLRQSLDAATSGLAYAAAFSIGRRVLADERARVAMLMTLGVMGAAVSIAFGMYWAVVWGGWWSAYEGTRVPSLDMFLPADIFGYRHHVAIFIALCVPGMVAVWQRHGGAQRALMTIGLLFGAFDVIAAGSRNIWLALVIASAVTLAWHSRDRARVAIHAAIRRRGVLLFIAVMAIAAIGLLGPSLANRLLTASTLSARAELWSSSFDAWASEPLTGMGPGSFPFLLTNTDYFAFNDYAARHPDNAVVQMAAEAGILGLAALAVLLLGLGPRLFRRGAPPMPSWGVFFFLTVCLAANPSEFGFLIAPFLAFAAYVTHYEGGGEKSAGGGLARKYLALALVPTTVAYSLIASAAVLHEFARNDLAAERPVEAAEKVRLATILDPGLALYSRELGWLLLLDRENGAAEEAFRSSLEKNPTDAAAHRGLSLDMAAQGDYDAAVQFARRAIGLWKSDTRNELVAAHVEDSAGLEAEARADVIDAVQQDPWLAASSHWSAVGVDDPKGLIGEAAQAWVNGVRTTVAPANDLSATLMAALTADQALTSVLSQTATSEPQKLLLAAAMCDDGAAFRNLLNAGPQRPSAAYWSSRLPMEHFVGIELDQTVLAQASFHNPGLVRVIRGAVSEPSLSDAGYIDAAGYNHAPLSIPSGDLLELPTAGEGLRAWFFDPTSIVVAHDSREC